MRDMQDQPVTDLLTPPNSPPEVEEAHALYVEAVSMLEQARADRAAAEERVHEAHAADIRAVVEAANDGTEPADPNAQEREAREDLRRHETLLLGAEALVDERGDAVARAIDDVKDEWLSSLTEQKATAEADYRQAIATALDSGLAVAEARHVTGWLERFDGWKMKRGKAPPGVQRTLMFRPVQDFELRVAAGSVPGTSPFAEEIPVLPTLRALARAVDPPEPAPPTRSERRRAKVGSA